MKATIRLQLDVARLREVRVMAAEEDRSIRARLAARLEQIVRERQAYVRARSRAPGRLRESFDLGCTPP